MGCIIHPVSMYTHIPICSLSLRIYGGFIFVVSSGAPAQVRWYTIYVCVYAHQGMCAGALVYDPYVRVRALAHVRRCASIQSMCAYTRTSACALVRSCTIRMCACAHWRMCAGAPVYNPYVRIRAPAHVRWCAGVQSLCAHTRTSAHALVRSITSLECARAPPFWTAPLASRSAQWSAN